METKPKGAHLAPQKTEYYKIISQRILDVMKQQDIKQHELVSKLQVSGYLVNQSDVSKIMSYKGVKSIQTYNLVAIADVLRIDLNTLLAFDGDVKTDYGLYNVDDEHFVVDPKSKEISPYLNAYEVWFFTTKEDDRKLHKGELIFEPSEDGSVTNARMFLKTGEADGRGREVVKHYRGRLIVSPNLGIAYCYLINHEIGEISFLAFNHFTPNYEKVTSRIALALTSSAGALRRVTAHRMFLTTKRLDADDIDEIKGQFYMNDKDILIKEDDFAKLMEEAKKEDKMAQAFQRTAEQGIYYRLTDAVLKDKFPGDYDMFIKAVHLLRKYSPPIKTHKVEESETYLHEWLKTKQ